MIDGFILVKTEDNALNKVVDSLEEMGKMWPIEKTEGPYNIIAIAHTNSVQEMGDIAQVVKELDGVSSAELCFSVKLR